jgi:hypothetical protein
MDLRAMGDVTLRETRPQALKKAAERGFVDQLESLLVNQ